MARQGEIAWPLVRWVGAADAAGSIPARDLSWQGTAWLGDARQCHAWRGQVAHGKATRGKANLGNARLGNAVRGNARIGKAVR
jgi:hypothetical protein